MRERLIVLSSDEMLVETLQALTAEYQVLLVDAEADLANHLLGEHAGVAVLDAAAVTTPIKQLTARLKAQFPDLVLVVAGEADAQSALAAQITDGTVYRFLHKPVSEQRVKLFIEAARRRRGQEYSGAPYAEPQVAPSESSGLPLKWLLAGAGAVVVLGLAAWLLLREPAPPSGERTADAGASPAAAPPQRDEVLEQLLERAEKAFAAGALVAPTGESAADLFAQARARNANDPRPSEGLARVIDRLLTEAEQALLEERTDDAERLTEAARAIQPDHVRVAFLKTQIGKERERALLARARQAASSGNIEEAIAVLDSAVAGSGSTLVAEARQELVQQRFDERVRSYLRLAEERMSSGALVEPAQDNARFFIESARALAPDDPAVRRAQTTLRDRVIAQARSALAAGDVDEGERWILTASEVGASQDDLAQLRALAQQARAAAHAETMARLARSFEQRLAQGRLVDPANDSAKHYLARLTQADADHPSTQQARQALMQRMLAEARGAIGRQDFAGARRWLAEAREVGAAESDAIAIEQEILSAQQAQAEAVAAARREEEVINAASLERVRYVAPEYPPSALERGIGGWVDLEFTVTANGSTADVTVLGAEPAGVFEQAAIQAVRRWRYRPVERDGERVDVRARLRVRFAVQ